MAGRQYSMLYWQDGDLDHVGEIVMDEAEAFGNLAASRALHVLTGWQTEPCDCGLGFAAWKDGTLRVEHLEIVPRSGLARVDSDLEVLALAVGVLEVAI